MSCTTDGAVQVQRSYANTYGLVFDEFPAGAEYADRLFTLIQYIFRFAQWIATALEDPERAERYAKIAVGADLARFFISIAKALLVWESLLSLKMFYDRYTAADIRKAHEEHKWQPFMVEGAFKKEGVDADGNKVFVAPDQEGTWVTRDWMDVVMCVLIVVARTLTCMSWLHAFKLIDLGKAAEYVTGIVIAAWAAVLSLGLVQSLRDHCKETKEPLLNKRRWETASSTADCGFLMVDADLIGKNVFANALGAGVCIVSSALFFGKRIVYHP